MAFSHGAAAQSPTGLFSRSLADVPPQDSRSRNPGGYYLEALLNGQSTGLIVSCQQRGDHWWMPLKQLRALGLRVDDLQADQGGWVDLHAIAGLSASYDAAQQHLDLTVLASRRNLYVVRHAAPARDGDSARGALLNYDALVEQQEGESIFRAYTEQRLFGNWGVLSHRGIFTGAGANQGYVRHETTWTLADPEAMRSVTAGDFISRSLTWSRSVRLGGLQFGRNFALRPDLITYPAPEFSGEAAVPSTVDVYVNQVRQLTSEVPAGPFRIESPPALNGAGQATMVVRDALGRESVQTLDLYIVPQLLAKGLSDYSFETGLLRENFGLKNHDYRGGAVGSASLRYGLKDAITLESHAEVARGLQQLGAGALLQLGNFGRLNVSLSLSQADGNGDKIGIGYQYVSSRFSVTADMQQADAKYRDLPSLLGDLPARRQSRVFVGAQLGPTTYLGASYLVADVRDGTGAAVSNTRLLSLGFRQTLGRHASVAVNAFRDLELAGSSGVYLAVSMPLGRVAQMQSDYTSTDQRSGVSLTGRSPYEGGWDWMLRGSRGDTTDSQANARYTGDIGAVSLDLAQHADQERWQLGARGAFAWTGDSVIAGRYVQDGYAVISTSGIADIPVLHENRPAGHTNGDGYLLLSNVNSYQVNRVAIDPLSIPFGYRVDQTEQAATPRLSAGTLVRFPIDEPRGAVLTLVDPDGTPLEAGSRGTVVDSGTAFVVGYDGVAYLTELRDSNRLRVQIGSGSCEAEVSRDAAAGVQPDLGRIVCR